MFRCVPYFFSLIVCNKSSGKLNWFMISALKFLYVLKLIIMFINYVGIYLLK